MAHDIHANISPTAHFIERARMRHVPEELVQFLVVWGTEFRRNGASLLALIERKLPPELRHGKLARQARRLVLVLGDEGALVTGYWRADPVRTLKRRPKRRLSGGQLRDRRSARDELRQQRRGGRDKTQRCDGGSQVRDGSTRAPRWDRVMR